MKRSILSVLLLSCLAAGPVLADVEDDYKAAKKAYEEAGDVTSAMAILKKGADAGHAKSQVFYAYILDKAEFDEEALAYYRKAAAQGDPDGEFGVGTMYAAGEGVKKDEVEALKWFKMAGEKGHKQALGVIAAAYVHGHLGLDAAARSGDEALKWIRASAEKDDPVAMRALADAYRKGAFGLQPDTKRADELVAKANQLEGAAQERRRRRK